MGRGGGRRHDLEAVQEVPVSAAEKLAELELRLPHQGEFEFNWDDVLLYRDVAPDIVEVLRTVEALPLRLFRTKREQAVIDALVVLDDKLESR